MNQTQSAFDDFLLKAGSDLFQSYSNDREKEAGRKRIKQHINTASKLLQASDAGNLEHVLALVTLCHAYKALAVFDWNWETKIDLDAFRQFIECLTILGEISNLSEKSKSYIAEQRLWACERYRRALSEQDDETIDHLSVDTLDDIVDQDFVKVVAAKSRIIHSEKVEDVLYHALYERRVGTKVNMDAAPLESWWRDDVDDRSIFLLRKIRLGKDFYSISIWQWQFETMLRSIATSFQSENCKCIIERIAMKQNIFSAHKSGKFRRPKMDERVFWLRCWRTQYYEGFRVYAAAIALKREFVETIIAAPIPDSEKRKALCHLRPLTVFSAGAMKTYQDHLKLAIKPEIYQHIISGCMLK